MKTASKGRLDVESLSKRFGSTDVLRSVGFSVENGEFLTILGPSGSGKTTILRLIGGFIAPTEGRILFGGADITGVPIHRRPFNTVFQDYALFPHMTVGQNVGYGLLVRRVKRPEIAEHVREALSVVSLEGLADRYPSQLSGGQRQRVALARALICQPKLILLDEPLAALDAELRRQMRRFLKSLQRRVRITFLFVTHDQEEAISMSDRICVINDGVIEQIGSPQDIYYRPRTGFVATFFGENNLLPGRMVSGDGDGSGIVDTACGRIAVNDARLVEFSRSMPVTVAVRPEALRIAAVNGQSLEAGPEENRLDCVVNKVDFVGPTSQIRAVSAATPDHVLLVNVPSRAGEMSVRSGDRLALVWRASDCAVVPGSVTSPASSTP